MRLIISVSGLGHIYHQGFFSFFVAPDFHCLVLDLFNQHLQASVLFPLLIKLSSFGKPISENLEMLRFELWAVECMAQMLPVCYAAPIKNFLYALRKHFFILLEAVLLRALQINKILR